MSEAKGEERSHDGEARQMFAPNAAVLQMTALVGCLVTVIRHTSDYVEQSLTQVLSRLLANPEYIEPLRQDIEAAVAEEGWTKAGLDKMYKVRVDSFKAYDKPKR